MLSRPEIRARARAALGGKLFDAQWLYPLLVLLVVSAISSALSFTYVGTLIVYGLLMTAMANYYVGLLKSPEAHKNLNACIDGAKKDIGGNIVTGLLYSVFLTLWTMLFIIPGIVKSCAYAMTFYIKNDHPEYTATEAITESRRMMDGHKMEYFVLQLSFIGWYIVGALCCGVGALWVSAYQQAANTVFYQQLKGDGIEAPYTMIDNGAPASDAAPSDENTAE